MDCLKKNRKIILKSFGNLFPIAEYVGLHFFKRKLDDIAFKAINPEMAAKMEALIETRKNDEIKALALVKSEIEMLKINNLNKYEIQGRIKVCTVLT